MKNAWAGGPDFDMKQQQVQQVYQEYRPVKEADNYVKSVHTQELSTSVEIKEPDFGDHIYVWLRTQVPSWVIVGSFFLVIITIIVRKFRGNIKVWLKGVLSD